MQLKVSPISRQECSAEEWQARVDLAAAHRLAVMHGFHEGIFNHLTLAVPGKSDRYYQIPFGMHWSEVKASSFMEVGIDDGKVKRGAGDVERSAYCIHAPIHKLQPKTAAAVFHTHMPYTSALTRLEDPRIKEIGQTEVGMIGEIAYDDTYTGPAFEHCRGRAPRRHPRRQGHPVHGQPRRHHGGRVRGSGLRPALLHRARGAGADLRHVDGTAAQAAARAGGGEDLRDIGGARFYDGPTPAERHFDALKRILDRKEPDYVE